MDAPAWAAAGFKHTLFKWSDLAFEYLQSGDWHERPVLADCCPSAHALDSDRPLDGENQLSASPALVPRYLPVAIDA